MVVCYYGLRANRWNNVASRTTRILTDLLYILLLLFWVQSYTVWNVFHAPIREHKIRLSTGAIVIVMLTRPYGAQQPQLLARYPLTDHKVEITTGESWIVLITQYVNRHCFEQDFPLPRDMVFFCQPDGTTSTSRCASVHLKRWECWQWKQQW